MLNRLVHQKEKGFTLVEMAIVLVIIGIILAAVMKGRDLISSGEETRQEQSFFQKWLTITNDYYKATKRPLGDGKKYGGFETTSDGYSDTLYAWNSAARDMVFNATNTVGMDPCMLVKSNLNDLSTGTNTCPESLNPFQTMLDTEFSGKVRTYVAWLNYTLTLDDATGSGTELRRKNVLAFINVPIAYAKRLDSTIDGTVDGAAGKCLNLTGTDGTPITVDSNILNNGLDWTDISSTNYVTTSGGGESSDAQTCTPADWATDAGNRDVLYTVGIVLDY
jgi:prepilin-type N-terminal cleavage/methylation domain-containing protein